jgi:hypothetical protein
MALPNSNPLALAGIALVLVAGLAYWGYGTYTQSQARKAAAALVKDTSERLREALVLEAEQRSTTVQAVARLEEHVAAVERNYAGLRRLDAEAPGEFVEAADDYLITSREILRRIAVSNRARRDLAGSSEALRGHMRSDRGAALWPGEAVRLREGVDRDYRDYRLAAETLVKLIESFPASQARIAPHVEAALLIDSGILAAARTAAFNSAKTLAAMIDSLTNLESHR